MPQVIPDPNLLAPSTIDELNRAPSALPEEQGFKLWPYAGYWENLDVWGFMELSVEGGARYKIGKDSEGEWIFQQHKKEDKVDAKKRRQRSSVLNYADFFASRFHGYATGKKPKRVDASDVRWRLFLEDATGSGESFAEFMEGAQRASLELSPAWMGIDVRRLGAGEVLRSEADGLRLGLRAKVFHVDPRNVIDYQMEDGNLRRVVIREERRVKASGVSKEETQVFYLEWTEFDWVRWREVGVRDREYMIVAREPVAMDVNPWGFVPYVPLHFGKPRRRSPMFSRCMIHDCADLQRDVFRLKSLYYEELFNRTFSTLVLAGTTADEIGSQLNQTLLVIEDPEARVAAAGADTAQAESLLEALKWVIRNMFRVAQFESSGDPAEVATRSAESGKKKARDLEGLYQVLSRFATATQAAENRLLRMWEVIEGKTPGTFAKTTYPLDYNVQSTQELIDELKELMLAEFPPTFIADVKKGIMERMRSQLPRRLWSQIEAELERIAANDLAEITSVVEDETVPASEGEGEDETEAA